MVNHPVHILNEKGILQPTALIPFCSFAGNMKILGQKLKGFSVPVCTAFKPTLFNGKMCYSVNVNDVLVKEKIAVKYGEMNGLSLLIDVNQDRHFGYFGDLRKTDVENEGHFLKSKAHDREISIFINSLEPLKVVGGGNIALEFIKEIEGDKAYIEYATKNNICNDDEKISNCSARFLMNLLEKECKCIPYELHGFFQV